MAMDITSKNLKKKFKNTHKNNYSRTRLSEASPSFFSEAYKAIRTNFQFSISATNRNIITISSTGPGEGKSTTSSNLAITIAQTGKKVLLVDCDLRKPVQHQIFKVTNRIGISSVIAQFKTFDECVINDVDENLDLLTAGPIPPNPSELLGSQHMKDFLEYVSKLYDYVIIDMPPIALVADALVLAPNTAGMILVTRQNVTHMDLLDKVIKNLEFSETKILGFIMTEDVN